MAFTREQIEAIEPGKSLIAFSFNGQFPDELFSIVQSIHAKQPDIAGYLFVCGYREYGQNAQISFSIKEGDETDYRFYRIKSAA